LNDGTRAVPFFQTYSRSWIVLMVGVGRRTPDAQLFEPLDERRLGEPGRRWVLAIGLDLERIDAVALGQRRRLALLLVSVVALVAVHHVDQPEPWWLMVVPGSELDVAPRERFAIAAGEQQGRRALAAPRRTVTVHRWRRSSARRSCASR
jgi:hypothetical protein